MAAALAACAQSPPPRTDAEAPYLDLPESVLTPQGGAGTSDPTAKLPPGGPQWTKPDATKEEYRADLESCFRYAEAQIAHDERIETDTGAAFDAAPGGLGVTELRSQMSAFERSNRRASLLRDCMRDKGYVEQR